MKLKPISYAIIAAGMVVPTYAAYVSIPAPKASCGMPSGMTATQAIIAGNSYDSGVNSSVCWFNRVKFSGSLDVGYRDVSGYAADSAYSDNTYGTRFGIGNAKAITRALNLHQIILSADARLAKNWNSKIVMRWGFENTPVDYHSLVTVPDIGGAWTVEEAYVTYSDSARSPLFMKAGRGFVPFGNYANPFEFTPTLIQALSQLNESYIQLGIAAPSGWNASVSGWTSSAGFSGSADPGDWQYAIDLGFNHSVSGVGIDFDASYIADINEVRSNRSFTHLGEVAGSSTKDRAWQLGLSTNVAGLDLGARYLNINTTNTQNIWGVHAGYLINMLGHDNTVALDYESANSAATPLDSRFSLGWILGISENVDAEFKYTTFSLQKHIDTDVVPVFDPALWTITVTGRF